MRVASAASGHRSVLHLPASARRGPSGSTSTVPWTVAREPEGAMQQRAVADGEPVVGVRAAQVHLHRAGLQARCGHWPAWR